MDADKSISVTLEHSGKLNEGGYAFLQCAVLYTAARGRPSPSPLVNGEVDGSAEAEEVPEMRGQRRVRVLNLAVQVAGLAGSVFRFADMDAVVVALLRRCESGLSHRSYCAGVSDLWCVALDVYSNSKDEGDEAFDDS